MTDEQVLNMPCRRFWSMERQITIIEAGDDMRSMSLQQAMQNKDAFESTRRRLVLMNDEVYRTEINMEPTRDSNVAGKLKAAMRQ